MQRQYRHAVAFILAAVALLAPTARAQNSPELTAGFEAPIGKVVSASGSVFIEHAVAVVLQANLSRGAAPAKTGDFVYRGDVVQTGSDGKLALVFTDGSAFNLSSNGRMVLDQFLYDPNSTSNSTLISLTKGNLSFVAGKIAKTGDMKVDTPVGTMGIRGTTPHVEIANDGSVRFSTLVEGKKSSTTAAPQGNQQNRPAAPRRQATAPTPAQMSPEQASIYNRLFNLDLKICRNC